MKISVVTMIDSDDHILTGTPRRSRGNRCRGDDVDGVLALGGDGDGNFSHDTRSAATNRLSRESSMEEGRRTSPSSVYTTASEKRDFRSRSGSRSTNGLESTDDESASVYEEVNGRDIRGLLLFRCDCASL